MRRIVPTILLAITGLVFTTQSATYASNAPVVYLGYSNDTCNGYCTLSMLEFTVTTGRVVGVFYTDTVEGSLPNAYLSSSSERFTGTERGGNLTLYFGSFGATPVFATISGRTLSIQVPQSNGTVEPEQLGKSTLVHYNQAITSWQNVVARANAQAAAQQRAAAAAAARKKQLLDNLNNAITTVDNDLSVMQSPGNLSGDLGQVDGDLGQVKADLGQVHADNRQLSSDAKSGEDHGVLCEDVAVEYQDAQVTVQDGHVMLQDVGQVAGDVQQTQGAIASAAGDWAIYWAAQHALPTYRPTTPIPPLKVAVGEGDATIRKAVVRVNAAIHKANAYIVQAYALPNAAQAAMHCGSTQKVPQLALVFWRP